MEKQEILNVAQKLKSNIEQVIKGKETEIEKVVMALLCSGHILLEDLPGTGKTTLAKALAKSISCEFKRIQFTPDLLPSDLTGMTIYYQKQEKFVLKEGPVFTNILLADEINRATPRTQSSLLECMEERQVTIDGTTHVLQAPFVVIATQNPVETQGTFPLPEAQLDRFFIKLSLGYPDKASEIAVLGGKEKSDPLQQIESVVSREEVVYAQQLVKQVKVTEAIKGYIVDLANATRIHKEIQLGLSMRGTLAILRGAQAYAVMQGRDYVLPDDIQYIFKDVSSHRIMIKGYYSQNHTQVVGKLLDELLMQVIVPIE